MLMPSGLSQSYLHLNARTKSRIYRGIRDTSNNRNAPYPICIALEQYCKV